MRAQTVRAVALIFIFLLFSVAGEKSLNLRVSMIRWLLVGYLAALPLTSRLYIYHFQKSKM